MNGPGGMVLDGNAVRSVDRAAALLLALGECQGEAGVTELARRLGLHKSTASRLLATLQKRGLVEQDDETGKYRLGLVVIRLAERAERTLDLRGIALPELERLARLTHETTGLGILDGDTLLAVAQVDGPNLVAVGDWTGRATPLHCVASGKVLLSSLAEREVLRVVRRGLVTYTERTIVELEPLLEELARIRRRGYRHRDRRIRARAQRGRRAGPRRARQCHRRGRHLGPGLPTHPAPDPGAGGPGARGGRGHLGPAGWRRRLTPTRHARLCRDAGLRQATLERSPAIPPRGGRAGPGHPHRRGHRAAPRPDLRPRRGQDAARPRGDRGHGAGAERRRAQEADGHARRARCQHPAVLHRGHRRPDDPRPARARHRAGDRGARRRRDRGRVRRPEPRPRLPQRLAHPHREPVRQG